MHITAEQQEHYNFYVDNCSDGEIPISLELWVEEHWEDVELILNEKETT